MKLFFRLFFLVMAMASLSVFSGCGEKPSANTEQQTLSEKVTSGISEAEISEPTIPSEPVENKSNILVAYFSATGTTKSVAEKIANVSGANIYEIVPEQPYTPDDLDYGDNSSRTTVEMNDPSARPAISGYAENMEDYGVIFVGYPIWWGEAPRIISTFMESYDFSGKKVIPFCTSGGSGYNDSTIKPLADNAEWITGKRFRSDVSEEDIGEWINDLEISFADE